MRTNQVRKQTLGAMMLALYGIVMAMDTMSAGFLLSTIPFLLPIPFVLYTREYGLSAGLTVATSAFILGFFLAPFYQVILAVMYVLIGVIYGWGINKDLNDKQLLFITFGFVLIITLVTVILMGAIFGYDLLSEIQSVIDMARSILGDQIELLDPNIFMFTFMIALLLQSILEAYVIHMLSTIVFLYMKKKPARKVKLRDINYPASLSILSALALLLMMYVNNQEILQDYQLIISFIGTIGFMYLSYLGLLFFYKDKRFNKWAIYSIIIFILTISFYAPIHLAIGLFTSLSGVWRNSDE